MLNPARFAFKYFEFALCSCQIGNKNPECSNPVWRGQHCPECGTHLTKDGFLLTDDKAAIEDWLLCMKLAGVKLPEEEIGVHEDTNPECWEISSIDFTAEGLDPVFIEKHPPAQCPKESNA